MRTSLWKVLPLFSLLIAATGCPTPPSSNPEPDGGTPVTPDAGEPTVPDAGTLTLSVVAGSAGGDGTLDGPREQARFMGPVGLARDAQGNLFVADSTACSIRKIDPNGVVSTFAGSPTVCGSGDGSAAEARFSDPVGIVIDSAGNLFVTDAGNLTIRKITPAGDVSTLAGMAGMWGTDDGTGVEARFSDPQGLAIDGAGNLYVADKGGFTIRKITPEGTVTTLAGNPNEPGHVDGTLAEARFKFVSGIVSDEAGNLWITEEAEPSVEFAPGPFLVRHISVDGQVTTLAGDPESDPGNVDGTGTEARFDGLDGIARDADGNLYVVERNNAQVRKITAAGVVTRIAGHPGNTDPEDGAANVARFVYPRGVLVLPGANGVELLVSDYAGPTLRKIDANGNVTTWAGSPIRIGSNDGPAADARFWGPADVIDDGNGGYIVADTENHTLRKIAADGTVSTWLGVAGEPGDTNGTGGEVRFNRPRGLVRDANGNLFLADSGNHLIRKITPDGTVSLFAGGPGPRGGGDFVDGPLLDARFFNPLDLAIDPSGRMFVADGTNNAIRMIDTEGEVTTIAGSGLPGFIDGIGTLARLQVPSALAVGPNGELLVADTQNHAIRKVAFDGEFWQVSTFAGALPLDLEEPTPGDADGMGNDARFSIPQGVTFDGGGNLLVADTGNHLIRKISPDGEVTTWAGQRGHAGFVEGALPASLFEPMSVYALPSGKVLGTFVTGVFSIERK